MNTQVKTQLAPYSAQNSLKLNLQASARRSGAVLSVEFEVEGDLNQVLFPEAELRRKSLGTSLKNSSTSPETNPPASRRLDRLWEHTCFEAFLSLGQEKSYWELNFSPSGDWNLYHFESYRSGQTTEDRVNRIEYEVMDISSHLKRIKIGLDLSQLISVASIASGGLSLGLTAVIEAQDHNKSYWAIQHLASRPDFHIRESFSLKL